MPEKFEGSLPPSPESREKKQKLFIVHRIDFEKGTGATQHHFSDALSKSEAQKLVEEWKNIRALPRKGRNPVVSVEVKMEAYKTPVNYDDGELQKIIHENNTYFWKSDGRVVTIYKNESTEPIFAFTGDPHDRTRAGVLRVIKEKKL